jgi:hypothetical protein
VVPRSARPGSGWRAGTTGSARAADIGRNISVGWKAVSSELFLGECAGLHRHVRVRPARIKMAKLGPVILTDGPARRSCLAWSRWAKRELRAPGDSLTATTARQAYELRPTRPAGAPFQHLRQLSVVRPEVGPRRGCHHSPGKSAGDQPTKQIPEMTSSAFAGVAVQILLPRMPRRRSLREKVSRLTTVLLRVEDRTPSRRPQSVYTQWPRSWSVWWPM